MTFADRLPLTPLRGRSTLPALALLFASLILTPSVVRAEEPVSSPEARIERLEKLLAETRAELSAARAGAPAPVRLSEVERKIEILAQEIEAMKIGEAAPAADASKSAFGLGPAASKVYQASHGVSVGGYGEAVYRNYASEREDGSLSGAKDQVDLARAVLYFGYKFDSRFVFNSEIEYAHALTGPDEDGEVEVEFAYLDWNHSPAFSLRGGLLLVPMGLVNEFHEPTVYFGNDRPVVENRILPSTWRELGLGAVGEAGSVSWRLYLVNGLDASGYASEKGIRDGRQVGSLALAEDWALTGRLDWRPVPGLVAGASFFSGDSGQGLKTPAGESIGGRTTVWDLHAEWRNQGWQVRALYAGSRIADAAAINQAKGFVGSNSIGSRQSGWYVEAGFDLFRFVDNFTASLTPFVRWESLDTQERVPAGWSSNPKNDRDFLTLGMSFKPIENIVLKGDWRRARNEARTGVDQWSLGLGYIF